MAGSTKTKSKALYDVDASVAALPPIWHGVLTRFRERMNGNAADSTRNDYHRFAKHFIAWCYSVGLKIDALPRDTPFRYYEARGWVGSSASYGNMVTSGLRALIEWSQGEGANGPGIPDLDFPASIRPPKRKPRIEGDVDMSQDPNGSTVNVDAVAPAGAPIADELLNPPPAVAPSAAAPPPVTAAPSAPAPGNVQPPAGYQPGVSERPLARQHVTNRRQTQVKDPLGAVMPQGGFIQLERVSDGTDGLAPGQRMDIGRYRINDIQGYNDFGRFVHEQVHPYFDPPLQRTAMVVYVGVRYDSDERKVGAPSEIRVSNTLVAGRSNGNNFSHGPIGAPSTPNPRRALDQFGFEQVERGGSTGNPQVDAVMQNALQQLNRYNEEAMERNRRYEQALEEARRGDGRDRSNDLMFALMHKPEPSININAVMDGAVAKIQAIMSASKPAAIPYIPPPVKDDVFTGKLVDALTMRDSKPAQDPMALAERVVALTRPAADPMLAFMQEQNRRLETTISDLSKKIDEKAKDVNADGPEAWFKRQMMFEDMMDRRMQRAGAGQGADWATAINTLFDKLPAALKELRLGGALTAPEAKAREGQPQQQQQQQQPAQQQELQASPAMNEAFSDLGAAFDGRSDQGVLTGVFKLITSIAQSPAPWPSVLPELDASIRAVETADELQFVVQRLFMACLQTPISKAKPGIVRFIADVLAYNFAAVCTTLSHPVRDLPGVALTAAPAPVAAAPAPAAASPTVTPRPAPPVVPTPAPVTTEEEEGDDGDGDGDESASGEEEEETEPIGKPETDGALGVDPLVLPAKKVATA